MEIDTFELTSLMEQEQRRPFSDMGLYLRHLTSGTYFSFAKLPDNDRTAVLLNDLKTNGFVAENTKIEHFRVIFGIPLHKSQTPFEPIKWLRNKQLFRFFICNIFPHKFLLEEDGRILPVLFADKYGEPLSIPQSDKKRLKYSSGYDSLKELLKKFKAVQV